MDIWKATEPLASDIILNLIQHDYDCTEKVTFDYRDANITDDLIAIISNFWDSPKTVFYITNSYCADCMTIYY